MKFAFIAKHRSIWPVAWLCEALGMCSAAHRLKRGSLFGPLMGKRWLYRKVIVNSFWIGATGAEGQRCSAGFRSDRENA